MRGCTKFMMLISPCIVYCNQITINVENDAKFEATDTKFEATEEVEEGEHWEGGGELAPGEDDYHYNDADDDLYKMTRCTTR